MIKDFYIKYNDSITEEKFNELVKVLNEKVGSFNSHCGWNCSFLQFKNYGYIRQCLKQENSWCIDNNEQTYTKEMFYEDFVNDFKWCIKVTEENVDVLNQYLKDNKNKYSKYTTDWKVGYVSTHLSIFYSESPSNGVCCSNMKYSEFVEITFDKFKEMYPQYFKEEIIEYYEFVDESSSFTKGKIYKLNPGCKLESYCAFTDDKNEKNGWAGSNHTMFKPSTKEAYDKQQQAELNKSKQEVVHCKTQQELDFAINYLKYPMIGESIKHYQCVDLINQDLYTLEDCKSEGDIIISFEEWCNKNGISMEKQKYIPEVGDIVTWHACNGKNYKVWKVNESRFWIIYDGEKKEMQNYSFDVEGLKLVEKPIQKRKYHISEFTPESNLVIRCTNKEQGNKVRCIFNKDNYSQEFQNSSDFIVFRSLKDGHLVWNHTKDLVPHQTLVEFEDVIFDEVCKLTEIKLPESDLLEIAKKKYPIGTKFNGLGSDGCVFSNVYEIDSFYFNEDRSKDIWCNNRYRIYCKSKNQWAHIIELPLEGIIETKQGDGIWAQLSEGWNVCQLKEITLNNYKTASEESGLVPIFVKKVCTSQTKKEVKEIKILTNNLIQF